jgi:hypothetical protein
VQYYDYALIVLSLALHRPLTSLTVCRHRGPKRATAKAVDLISADPEAGAPNILENRNILHKVRIGKLLAILAIQFIFSMSYRSIILPPHFIVVVWMVYFILLVLTWQFITRDYDVTAPIRPQVFARIGLCLAALAFNYYPVFTLTWLYIAFNHLDVWKHHVKMPLRVIKLFITMLVATAIIIQASRLLSSKITFTITPYVVVLVCVQISHYLVPGRDKIILGEHWHSWLTKNRTHYLIISAYNWGWANFIDRHRVERFVTFIGKFSIILNTFTIFVETVPIISLLNYKLYLALLTGMTMLNFGIFILSGICFWEYILTNIAFSVAIYTLAQETPGIGLGFETMVVGAAIMCLPLFLDWCWSPSKLAWWDAPFVARMRWEIEGVSGRIYGLYNNYMCPFERDYGRIYGYFLVAERIIHGHLGIVWNLHLRDAIIATGGNQQVIEHLKAKYGVSFYDAAKIAEHDRFLIAMFKEINNGARKNILPGVLLWLKAPGGQFYYWGEKPAYHGQEPARAIRIFYTEKFFDEAAATSRTLRDQCVRTVLIPEANP